MYKRQSISIFIKVGAILGGIETNPPNSISPRKIENTVTRITPIRIAPGVFLTEREQIIRKPNAASKVSGFVKSQSIRNVALFETINPPFFMPLKPINKPTPEPIAILMFNGILSNIHLLKGVTLIITNKIPAKKTAPSEISHA